MNADYLDGLGKGLYSESEAARLSGVRAGRIRRWMQGYEFVTPKGERHVSPPVWRKPEEGGQRTALNFLDLMDIRVVGAFRGAGVSWTTLRAAVSIARDRFGVSHPFSYKRFKTDGKNVFLEFSHQHPHLHEKGLLDLIRDQWVFPKIMEPFLLKVDFAGDNPVRWWPLGKSRHVVIDPSRSFGQPITREGSVSTFVLAANVRAEGSIERVARWYDIPPSAVRDAVEFEEQPAA